MARDKMSKPQKLNKEEHEDIALASNLVLSPLLNNEGIQALGQLTQSAADMPAAVANAIFGALTQVRQALMQKQLPVSGKIWTAGGGVLDVVIQEVCQVLAGVLNVEGAESPDFMQSVKDAVFDQMSQAEAGGGSPPQGGPPAPQGPMPQDGNLLAPPQGGAPMGGMPNGGVA